ncbi:helix-turn-helix domain-containing protein [Agrobacterium deltaense]
MNMLQLRTPSQIALYEAARARALKKIAAAKLFEEKRRPAPEITPPSPAPEVNEEKQAPISFSMSASLNLIWKAYEAIVFGSDEKHAGKRTMDEIALSILERFPGVDLRGIKGKRRTRHLTFPRHLINYAIKEERPDLSYPQIGRWCGGRDHTTTLNSVRKIEEIISQGRLDAEILIWRERERERLESSARLDAIYAKWREEVHQGRLE